MRQLVVLFKLIVLTAALAAGASSAEPLAFQKHSIALVALNEAVSLRSDFDADPESDEPADLPNQPLPAAKLNPSELQFSAAPAHSVTANLPPARGPPLTL